MNPEIARMQSDILQVIVKLDDQEPLRTNC